MTRSLNYSFTLNNYTQEDETLLQNLECKYLVYGREVGESGTPHLQGTIVFATQRTLKSVSKKIPRAHLEKTIDLQKSILYCKKDNDVYEKGNQPIGAVGKKCTLKERASRNKRLREATLNELVDSGEINIKEVRALKNARIDLAQENQSYHHDDTRGLWYVGPPGTGKSRKAHEENPGCYIKAQNKWWDGYAGEAVVLLDDLDTPVLGHYLKIWGDRYPCTGEVKGGTVNLTHKQIIVTSNYTIDRLFKEDDIMAAAIKRRYIETTFYEKLGAYIDDYGKTKIH